MPPKKPMLTKAERKKRAEKKRAKFEQDHLEREINYTAQAVLKHEKKWKQMLTEIALPRMKGELEYAWHNFERVLDAKDFTISLLLDELKESEDQYARNIKSHMDNIDNLIVLCYDQIKDLKDDSKKVIENLYKAATFERTDIINITKGNEEYLKTMLYILENTKKESEKLIRGEYLSKQEVEISRLNDIRSKFVEELESKYNKIWKETTTFLRKHIRQCAQRKKEFEELNVLDEEAQRTIRKLWNKIKFSMDLIKNMRRDFDGMQFTQGRKIFELTLERNHYDRVFHNVKNILLEERQTDENNLTLLSLESDVTIKYLQELENKGEKILKLSAICRKYETLEEKTMAFPLYSVPEKESKEIQEIEMLNIVDIYRNDMVMFFNRVAQVDSKRFEMSEEADFLRNDNTRLRKKIHAYCQCFTCDGGTDMV